MQTNFIKSLLLLALIVFSSYGFSQNKMIDSLKLELLNHKTKDTTRVDLLNKLANGLYNNNEYDKATLFLRDSEMLADSIKYIKGKARSLSVLGKVKTVQSNHSEGYKYYEEALGLYKTISCKEEIAECNKDLGIYMYHNGKQREAIAYYKKSLDIYEELDKKAEKAVIFYEMGWSYIEIDSYKKAQSYLFKALQINEEIANKKAIASNLNGLAVTYANQGNYAVALDYYNQTLAVAKENENTRRILLTLGNMGTLYYDLKKFDKAIALYNETLTLTSENDKLITSRTYSNLGLAYKAKNENAKAYKYYQEGLKIYQEVNDKRGEAYILNNIADILFESGNYIHAIEHYKRSKNISLEIENQRGLCASYLGLTKIYLEQRDYDKARDNALRSNDISIKHNLLGSQRDSQELLSKIYQNTGNNKKALESYKKYKKLNDSLFNKENIEKIAQLEYEYKYKQALDSASIRELKLTKTVLTTSQDLEKSKRNLFLGVIGFLVMALVLGGIIFYLKLRNEKAKTQNIAIEQKLLRSQMTPHFIFNSLSVLQGMILNKEDKKSMFYLSKFSKLLRITLENSRDKLVPLNQELEAINNYLELQNLEASQSYDYTILVDKNIDESHFLIPPMLIQPFIENAIEHAFKGYKKNRRIDIQLKYLNKELICTITDNGIGIDTPNGHKSKDKKSLATTITSERLKILSRDFNINGSINIEDRKKYNEQGTLVTLVIPYKLEDE